MDWTANFLNTINGLTTSTTSTTHGIDPATCLPLANVPLSTAADLDTAVSAAHTAFKSWSKTPWANRASVLKKLTDLLDENRDAIAKLVVMETSKLMMMAGSEVDACVQWIRRVAEMELKEEVLEDSEARKVMCRWIALGIVAGILPWNFPASLICGKVGPAAITGNVIIIKPSPFTPYTALKTVKMAQAVFPLGVMQCLSGGDDLGLAMTLHPGIDKIAFTGSVATGKRIMESASKTLKRVTLELGGNDAAIVCKFVNIAKAAPSIATMAIVNSGQVCLAIKRVYIHVDVYEEFKAALIGVIKSFKIGPSSERGNFLSPVQNKMQYEKVKDMLADIKSKGYDVALGNERKADEKGFYINPTIVDGPVRILEL